MTGNLSNDVIYRPEYVSSILVTALLGTVSTDANFSQSSLVCIYHCENIDTKIVIGSGDLAAREYQPRTAFGQRLMALRRAYLEEGGKLLDEDGLEDELRRRRGGIGDV
ncbi:MAG: hypothetical protein LBP52_01685 [Burkholderiaceae bacterium]|jgi:hypothetical protein|nr:hypothetical protein [Burkholderiaceae bacterium]